MSAYNFEIGSDIYTMMNLEDDLGLDPPKQDPFVVTTTEINAADGLVYGHGWGSTAWRWGFISTANRAVLRAYCTSRSAEVVIRVRDDSAAWIYFNAIMIWPQENMIPINNKILDFAIEFRLTENLGASI